MANHDDDEPPLDPAVAAVQRRLRRLMAIAGLTLGVGFLAVLVAIVLRLVDGNGGPGASFTGSIVAELPAGASIVSVDLDGSRAAVLVEQGGGRRLLVYELSTGRLVGSVDFLAR